MDYQTCVVSFRMARFSGNRRQMTQALRAMSRHVLDPSQPRAIQLHRLSAYDDFRNSSGEEVKNQTPDWRAVDAAHLACSGVCKSVFDGLRSLPIIGHPADLYFQDGRARRLDLLVGPGDLDDDSPHGIMKSWLYGVTQTDPDYVPGAGRGLLMTDRGLTGGANQQVFDCSFDGVNIRGTAARSWLPFKVDHVKDCEGFFMIDDTACFALKCLEWRHYVQRYNLTFISVLTGHRDMEYSLDLGYSFERTALIIEGRLSMLAGIVGIPVIFGGFLTKGSPTVQFRSRAVSVLLFLRSSELRQSGVTFLDCGTCSAVAPIGDVFQADGELSSEFKAASLYALSRLTILSLHNLVTPSHRYTARTVDRDFVRFCSRRRAMCE